MVVHYRYFAFKGNGLSLWRYYSMVIELLFKWFNRRSLRRSYFLAVYKQLMEVMRLPKPELTDDRRFSITWLYEKEAAFAR
jgi:hypothetical protein